MILNDISGWDSQVPDFWFTVIEALTIAFIFWAVRVIRQSRIERRREARENKHILNSVLEAITGTEDALGFKAQPGLIDRMEAVEETARRVEAKSDIRFKVIDDMSKELKTNGGTSLKDVVMRLEKQMDKMYENQKLHHPEDRT